jgi:hypothetical protein
MRDATLRGVTVRIDLPSTVEAYERARVGAGHPYAYSVSLWGRSLYRGDSRRTAHRIAVEAAQATRLLGECVTVLGDGVLVTYRRGPQGIERVEY